MHRRSRSGFHTYHYRIGMVRLFHSQRGRQPSGNIHWGNIIETPTTRNERYGSPDEVRFVNDVMRGSYREKACFNGAVGQSSYVQSMSFGGSYFLVVQTGIYLGLMLTLTCIDAYYTWKPLYRRWHLRSSHKYKLNLKTRHMPDLWIFQASTGVCSLFQRCSVRGSCLLHTYGQAPLCSI